MNIDENGDLKLKNYSKKTTETDHNTIVIKLDAQPMAGKGDKRIQQKVRYR